jgi:hypothetical protein
MWHFSPSVVARIQQTTSSNSQSLVGQKPSDRLRRVVALFWSESREIGSSNLNNDEDTLIINLPSYHHFPLLFSLDDDILNVHTTTDICTIIACALP